MACPRIHILFVTALLSLFLLPANADALSVEVRAGAGAVGFPRTCAEHCSSEEVRGSYEKAGANAVFSPWTSLDLFVGAEYAESHELSQYFEGDIDRRHMHYWLDYSAVTFGIRYKPFPKKRVNLHLMLGGLAGRANYRVDLKDQVDSISLSGYQDSAYFVRPQAGIGAVIGLSKRFGLGFEAAYTAAVPAYTITVRNTSTGQVENKRLNSDADMFGMTLGVRYNFE